MKGVIIYEKGNYYQCLWHFVISYAICYFNKKEATAAKKTATKKATAAKKTVKKATAKAKKALDEDVLSYEGTPVAKVTEDGTLRFAMTWNATVSAEDYVRLGLKINSRFNNSDAVSIESVETNLPNNLARINETITVEVKNMKKNDVLWLKGVPVASDYAYLTIENVELVRNN